MRAITVVPGDPGSARLMDVPDPEPRPGELLVENLRLGVCGTDREIVWNGHGEAPEGEERLVLGHELLGRVREAPPQSGFEDGELVAGIVRRPDPEPCTCCARGEWDMCRNGGYTERGIKGRHGFGSEKVALEAEFAVRVPPELGALGVLSEPASIVAKAWEQIDRISARACAERSRVLVTGAGPIGMLAALLAAERDLEVHVLDRAEGGVKPGLVRDLGGHYHSSSIAEASEAAPPDVVVECTGVGELVLGAMTHAAPGAIVCLAGVGASSELRVDMGKLNNEIVFGNRVVFGSVNANRRHFDQAIAALVGADRAWLARLITRTVPFERWQEALERGEDDVKAVVELAAR